MLTYITKSVAHFSVLFIMFLWLTSDTITPNKNVTWHDINIRRFWYKRASHTLQMSSVGLCLYTRRGSKRPKSNINRKHTFHLLCWLLCASMGSVWSSSQLDKYNAPFMFYYFGLIYFNCYCHINLLFCALHIRICVECVLYFEAERWMIVSFIG